jgi:hypothetical protein
VAVDIYSHDFLYNGSIYVEGEGEIASIYHPGNTNLYSGQENALTLETGARLYNFSAYSPSLVNITNGSDVYYYNDGEIGQQFNLSDFSTLWLYGNGGNTITANSGGVVWIDNYSSTPNTVNVSNNSDAIVWGTYAQINVTDDSYVGLYGGGNQVSVSDGSEVRLSDAGGNVVNVGEGSSWIDVYSSTADTINVSGGADANIDIYGESLVDNTINIVNGYSSVDLHGNGGNTLFVQDGGARIYDDSVHGNTINLKGDAGLGLYGDTSSADTVVVSNYNNWFYGSDHYIEMGGSAGLYLDGGGNNTVVVSGTNNYIADYSSLTSAVELTDGAGLYVDASHDTFKAVTGATDNQVVLDEDAGPDLVSLNANSGSAVTIYAAGNEFVNATGDTINIDTSVSDITVFVYDSGFSAGKSSDVIDFTGTGSNDTVKFVSSLISAAAAFGATSPATLTVEATDSGSAAILAASH